MHRLCGACHYRLDRGGQNRNGAQQVGQCIEHLYPQVIEFGQAGFDRVGFAFHQGKQLRSQGVYRLVYRVDVRKSRHIAVTPQPHSTVPVPKTAFMGG